MQQEIAERAMKTDGRGIDCRESNAEGRDEIAKRAKEIRVRETGRVHIFIIERWGESGGRYR